MSWFLDWVERRTKRTFRLGPDESPLFYGLAAKARVVPGPVGELCLTPQRLLFLPGLGSSWKPWSRGRLIQIELTNIIDVRTGSKWHGLRTGLWFAPTLFIVGRDGFYLKLSAYFADRWKTEIERQLEQLRELA